MPLWADPADPLEGGAERERAAVPDLAGNGVDGGVGVREEIGGQVDAPRGEVGHRWSADEVGEAAGEGRSGHAAPCGERGDRPGMSGVAVDQPQDRADDGVAVGSVPRRRIRVRAGEPRAEDVDQQEIQEPVEHEVLARLVAHGLLFEQRHQRGSGVGGVRDQQRR